ncbi:MAG: zinc ribbon domain-containing protein [Nitrospirae bacterium]|nr:zinc ribbon domain-containing protein [Nitrospirota bacterium]
MPIYEYKCEKCRKHHEIMQKITEKPLTVCPSCGGSMKKLISSTSFVLKGSGWYVTDYGDKNRRGTGKEGAGKKDKVDSSVQKEHRKEKTDSAAAKETKKESKSESKSSQKSKE